MALLSCRGSSSPKFLGSLPQAAHPWTAGSLSPGCRGTAAQHPRAPHRDPQTAVRLEHLRKTRWGAKTNRCHQDTGPPTQFALGAVPERKGYSSLGSLLLRTHPLLPPPRTLSSVRRSLGCNKVGRGLN